MSATAQLPRSGDMIAGKYVLDRLLGQGGMGAVFAARHLKLSKAVAIKIMLADAGNPEASQRFINEGRAAANIQNEHVVRVDDVDEEMGYAYMVLELLEGQDLAQILEAEPAKRIAPHLAVGWVMQGLRGVSQAHALGIVHRDLKPSNLFLAKRKDGSSVVKVLDFGISKATGQGGLNAAPSALTSTKAMLGSPLYMSPEQLRNAKSVDHRADIWAMGIILYELITGELPFMGDNLGELFANILESDPIPLGQRAGVTVPPGLNEVVMRCLQRKPEMRFQSAAELMHALAPFEPLSPALGPLGGTAFLPNGHAPHPSHPTANAQAGIVAPSAPQVSSAQHLSSSTGPHAHPPATAASHPHLTPPGQFVQTTGSGWQQGSAAGVPKSNLPMLLGVFGGVAIVGTVLGILAWQYGTKDPPITSSPPPAVSSVLPLPEVLPSASAAKVDSTPTPPPSSGTTAAVSASAPVMASAPAPAPNHRPTAVTRPTPAPQTTPTPQPPAPTPIPAPKPAPKAGPQYEEHR